MSNSGNIRSSGTGSSRQESNREDATPNPAQQGQQGQQGQQRQAEKLASSGESKHAQRPQSAGPEPSWPSGDPTADGSAGNAPAVSGTIGGASGAWSGGSASGRLAADVQRPNPAARGSAGWSEISSGESAEAGAPAPERQSAASQAVEQVKRQAAEIGDEVRHAASEARQSVSESAANFRDRAADSASRQKDHVAEELSHFGVAMRSAADRLREEQDHRVAEYAQLAAEQIDRGAQYLRSRDLRGLIGDVESFARRRPGVFLGALFVAGLGVSRFLRASARH